MAPLWTEAYGLPRPTRPCLACGRPILIERLRTADLAPRGWRPFQAGALQTWCGHRHDVVPWQGSDGLWTLVPLVGTLSSMSPLTIGTAPPAGLQAWLGNSDTIRQVSADPALQAEMVRLQGELAQMESLGDPATCHLCGEPAVTEEHAPSQASGNTGRLLGGRIDPVATRVFRTLVWTTEEIIGGSVVKTLCKPCNNDTGRRYNQAYTAFEAACRPLARPEAAGTRSQVQVVQRPLVAKQVLTAGVC